MTTNTMPRTLMQKNGVVAGIRLPSFHQRRRPRRRYIFGEWTVTSPKERGELLRQYAAQNDVSLSAEASRFLDIELGDSEPGRKYDVALVDASEILRPGRSLDEVPNLVRLRGFMVPHPEVCVPLGIVIAGQKEAVHGYHELILPPRQPCESQVPRMLVMNVENEVRFDVHVYSRRRNLRYCGFILWKSDLGNLKTVD